MDRLAIVNRAATDETDPMEGAARMLCVELGVEPWDQIPAGCEPRYAGYEGNYFMNWARNRVEEADATRRVLPPLKADLSAEREMLNRAVIPPADDPRLDKANR